MTISPPLEEDRRQIISMDRLSLRGSVHMTKLNPATLDRKSGAQRGWEKGDLVIYEPPDSSPVVLYKIDDNGVAQRLGSLVS